MASAANPYIVETYPNDAAASWRVEPDRPWREVARFTARYGIVAAVRAIPEGHNIRWRLRRGDRVLEAGRVR
jgi:hypothetical protein